MSTHMFIAKTIFVFVVGLAAFTISFGIGYIVGVERCSKRICKELDRVIPKRPK